MMSSVSDYARSASPWQRVVQPSGINKKEH
jgi:hypothetical protein